MSIIDTLIFDRTQSDVSNDTEKSYISYKDLNRVEEAVKYLSDILNKYSYPNKVNVKINWNMSDFRKQEDCDRIKENYEILKNIFGYKFDIPEFRWEEINEANYIEEILYNIYKALESTEKYFLYCGVSNAGQERIWQKRFINSKRWFNFNYTFSQYLNTDTVSIISDKQEGEDVSKTPKINLLQIDNRQKVIDTITTFNKNMRYIDSLM